MAFKWLKRKKDQQEASAAVSDQERPDSEGTDDAPEDDTDRADADDAAIIDADPLPSEPEEDAEAVGRLLRLRNPPDHFVQRP